MSEVNARTAAVLDRVLEEAPEPAPTADTEIGVANEIMRIARAWPGPLSPAQAETLDVLCRKIAVAGKVWATYDSAWAKPREKATPLPGPYWPVLIAVLVAYAQTFDPGDTTAYGVALKRVNGALSALDLAAQLGDLPALGFLEAWLDDTVTAIVE